MTGHIRLRDVASFVVTYVAIAAFALWILYITYDHNGGKRVVCDDVLLDADKGQFALDCYYEERHGTRRHAH